jgi:D-arabinose 1-dehydrogenase-like Zn-dependent alcohol dehydrogenase
MKQQSILGSTMSDLNSFNAMMKKIHEKKYFPFMDSIFKMSDIQEAHKRIENRQQIGKIVLVP